MDAIAQRSTNEIVKNPRKIQIERFDKYYLDGDFLH